MADYAIQIEQLLKAATICRNHTIVTRVNNVKAPYPRWPEAFKACEVVWRSYLDYQTMATSSEAERQTVIDEANRLPN